jgi:hypothetical protein
MCIKLDLQSNITSPYICFVPCLAPYSRWGFIGVGVGFTQSDVVCVGYIIIFILFPLTFCLYSPVKWWDIRWYIYKTASLAHLNRHPSSFCVNFERYAQSWEEFLCGVHLRGYELWLLSLISWNFRFRLQFLFEYKPRIPIYQKGNFICNPTYAFQDIVN